eukprot:scaffold919_cov96-Skeletonema_dohrnii-CCMP3373.AAC.12
MLKLRMICIILWTDALELTPRWSAPVGGGGSPRKQAGAQRLVPSLIVGHYGLTSCVLYNFVP